MAPVSEQIVHLTVNCKKALGLTVRLESSHLPFLFTRVLVRDFRPIIRIAILAVQNGRHHFFPRCTVAFEFIGNHPSWRLALVLQHLTEKPLGSAFITAAHANITDFS